MINKIKLSLKMSLFALAIALSIVGLTGIRVHAACTLPPEGLVSWWPGEMNAKDIVLTSGNNGTLQGGTTFTTGMVGQTFSFDGVDDYVNIGNKVKPPLPLTVSAWLYINSAGTNTIFRNDLFNPSTRYYGVVLGIDSAGSVFSLVGNGGIAASYSRRNKTSISSLVPLGVWKHVAVVFNAPANQQHYVDGIEYSGTYDGSAGSLAYSSNNGTIGEWHSSDRYFDGQIDEVTVYNRALTAEEIQAIYAAGSSGKCKCNGWAVTLAGSEGNDLLTGTIGPDVILALGGDDTIDGLGGNDIICAGLGNDVVNGGTGNDKIYGEGGNDVLNGDLGNDTLKGGPGEDDLDGGLDNNCDGGTGNDTEVNCGIINNVP